MQCNLASLLLTTTLFSCGYSNINVEEKPTIARIEYRSESKMCIYYGYLQTNLLTITNEFAFIDTCGKFNVGDQIKIVKD